MRNIISVFIMIVVVVLVIKIDFDKNDSFSNNNVNVEKQWDRIASVIENAWDHFGLLSFQATPDSTIFIEMDETKSELQLRKYLEENVNKTDLNQYNIEITKKSLHEVETESFMMKASDIVYDYLQKNNYHDVDIYVPSIKPTPILKISIPKSSTRSGENIKKELEDVLTSKSTELPNKDISYEIQVIERVDDSTIESEALISDVVEDFQGTENHLIISDTDIFKGNGIYKMTWAQPSDSKDYKFHVTNNTGTNVTVQIQQSSQTQTYNLDANDSTTWVQSAASSGDHTIVVTTSDGRIFKGDVFVSKSDVPLN
ncbi:hypothetical protein [Lysinibacillus sp. FW12]|uniref:hypothetical protein n=1 Tax=Lysinibacillus sp. FW12 TaxID=3096079 RepID=UPI003D721E22